MALILFLSLLTSIALIRIKCNNKKNYTKAILTLFYMLFFFGTYYLARRITVYICDSDFRYGPNRFVWLCLLCGSLIYFPHNRAERDSKPSVQYLCREMTKLLLFFVATVLSFCSQCLKNMNLPCQMVGVLIILLFVVNKWIQEKYGCQERRVDIRDILLLLLYAGIFYYLGFLVYYKGMDDPSSYVLWNVLILFTVLLFVFL